MCVKLRMPVIGSGKAGAWARAGVPAASAMASPITARLCTTT